MDAQSLYPALSITEAEEFWTDGKDARQTATGQEPGTSTTSDSVGIDMPGVGVMPLAEVSSDCTRRECAGGEVGERSPDLAVGVQRPSAVDLAPGTPVHQMSLSDRLRAAVRQNEPLTLAEESSDGEQLNVTITPAGVAALKEIAEPDYRAIASELLAALYTMIGYFGMPTKNTEAAAEISTALSRAEAARVDEVIL